MANNAAQFAIELDKELDDLLDEEVGLIKQKVAMTALQKVVLRSPVDTGRFRGNWNVAIEQADLSISDDVDRSGGDTINAGSAVIMGSQPFDVIFISNNLPYAGVLEGGWSLQAPGGMVAITVAEIETMFR